MCAVAFTESGSASKRIDGRARSPFSHGFGGTIVAQPPMIAAAHATTIASMLREQCTNARFELVLALVAKTLLDGDDVSAAIDQVRARHALHLVRSGRTPVGIVDDGEACR